VGSSREIVMAEVNQGRVWSAVSWNHGIWKGYRLKEFLMMIDDKKSWQSSQVHGFPHSHLSPWFQVLHSPIALMSLSRTRHLAFVSPLLHSSSLCLSLPSVSSYFLCAVMHPASTHHPKILPNSQHSFPLTLPHTS
jgi:hypothetical protein